MRPLESEFEVEGLRYTLHISEDGQIAFFLTGGGTRRGRLPKIEVDRLWEWDDDEIIEAVDLVPGNALTVFARVKGPVLAWAHAHRPY